MENKLKLKFELYGLLYLDDSEKNSMNVVSRNFREHVGIYIGNAITLSKSLKSKGVNFTLLTNKKRDLENVLEDKKNELHIEEIPFITKVPSGIKFYSAHFKLDVFRFLSKVKQGYVGLCDLDMICINEFPQSLSNNIKDRIPMCYDISDQVIPAYGHDVIIRDLESILGKISEGRWTGGEFISGTPEFFADLIKAIDGIYVNYVANIKNLHHVGDEAVTSAALEIIRKSGKYVADAGALGIVGRYWSGNVLHAQKPFASYKNHFLLHLPADKKFLAKVTNEDLGDMEFLKMYSAHKGSFLSKSRKWLQKLKRKIK